jgi:Lecithin retinol acyltransferase
MMATRAQCRNDLYREPPLRGKSESRAAELTPGTQLFVSRAGYRHHGIYVGNGRIIHYAGRISHARGLIEEILLAEFAQQRAIRIERLPAGSFDAQEIVRRARSRLGERRYDLLRNNCEHFCNWCQLGESRSSQVERLTWPARLLGGPVRRLRTLLRSFREDEAPGTSAVGAE